MMVGAMMKGKIDWVKLEKHRQAKEREGVKVGVIVGGLLLLLVGGCFWRLSVMDPKEVPGYERRSDGTYTRKLETRAVYDVRVGDEVVFRRDVGWVKKGQKVRVEVVLGEFTSVRLKVAGIVCGEWRELWVSPDDVEVAE